MIRWLIFLFWLLSHFSWSQQPSLIRLTNGEWPPYLSQQLPHGGPSSQVVEEAFKLQGIDVEWHWFPWQRSYNLAKSGEFDGSVIWSDNEERRRAFIYSDPVLTERRLLFHLKGLNTDWEQIEDLKDYVFGGTIGYQYSQEFQNAEAAGIIRVDRTKEEWHNLKLLLEKRIDIFVVTEKVGHALIERWLSKEQADQITHSSKPLDTQQWSVLISNNSPHQDYYVKQFNRGLKKLKDSGQYHKIMQSVK